MARYASDYGRRRMRPDTGNFGPEYTDELYGGGYPGHRGAWSGAGGPGGYGRDYGYGGYGWDFRTGGYPARRHEPWYGMDDRDRGYGREYRAGGRGSGRTAYGYRGPGTDLGEDIARGYVSRWRDPRPGPRPGPGRGRW
jgi:hypothetical protein